jgi:hypothetical protein
MKCEWLLCLVLLSSGCAPLPAHQQSNGIQNANRALPSPTPETASSEPTTPRDESKKVPAEFMGVDFKNFSYQTNWRNRRVRLTNGEYVHPEGGGGDTYKFFSLDFADLNDGGEPIAIVRPLQVSCGVSCDGGSYLFYFYRVRKGKPSLFWRIETGSLAYECGLKSFVLSQGTLNLEVFRTCQTRGSSIQESSDPDKGQDEGGGGKFKAKTFTRFVFEFNNGQFIKKRTQIFPNPNPDIMNYDEQVSIRD